ncbi:MAG: hypothetical protein VYA55_19495 [Pseudomonadota bacterium]|nr:hypothetical protein [Pseudomonadota bacterium]
MTTCPVHTVKVIPTIILTLLFSSMVMADTRSQAGGAASFFPGADAAEGSSYTCRPGDSNWCSNGFQIACDLLGGGLSVEKDGGVTCAVPDKAGAVGSFSSGTTDGERFSQIDLTCYGECDEFKANCDKGKGGLSSEPDGGITCSVEDHSCSGCD